MSGYKPEVEDLILTRDADYIHTFETTSDQFPAGTTARIIITKTADLTAPVIATWQADEVTETEISFWIQEDDTNLIQARWRYRLMVQYPPASSGFEAQDFCWYRGKIVREQ